MFFSCLIHLFTAKSVFPIFLTQLAISETSHSSLSHIFGTTAVIKIDCRKIMNMKKIIFSNKKDFKLTAAVANGVKMHFPTPFQSHFCHFGYLIQNDRNIK